MSLIKSIKSVFGKSKKSKAKVKETHEQLKTRYLMEIKNIEASLRYDGPDTYSLRFFSVVKDFLSEYIGERGSMTLEEIDHDFKYKHIEGEPKKRARALINRLIPLEFGEKQIDAKEMKKLLSDFKFIVEKV